jgi:hypothetical protein
VLRRPCPPPRYDSYDVRRVDVEEVIYLVKTRSPLQSDVAVTCSCMGMASTPSATRECCPHPSESVLAGLEAEEGPGVAVRYAYKEKSKAELNDRSYPPRALICESSTSKNQVLTARCWV